MTDPRYPLEGKRVFVAGHRGMVGRALVRRLAHEPCEVVTAPRESVDLRRPEAVERWFVRARPDAVVLAAARVGGIAANQRRPATFLHDNLAIATSVIDAARVYGVERLLFLGSSCMYPREAAQPLSEAALMTGAPEPTNDGYATAKLAGWKLAETCRREHGCDFLTAIPTNLYGPGDTFDETDSHVVPALLQRFHRAKQAGARAVTVWGSGTPRREFLHVDDCADALVTVLTHADGARPVNVGTGADLPIAELARAIARVTGFEGELCFDTSKPDGMPRKRLDVSRLQALGWAPGIELEAGLADTYRAFLAGDTR
ncbi:GDP-L-fucose synthase [Limimonas halophila]|uniref:GDP-L-fucose synthase n=1 Tax=Limimonas halophila TaxID=1082479 RepID=A0A1G7Q2S3_9PROT|nr:GDP-L-fucose synthase [Limimonas halophila]SDF92775.1 GDP-L-fucose synthase [Limimonas halophila]